MIFGDLSYQQWAVFLLVLLRCSTLMATLPFFGSPNIPPLAKAGLSLALAILLTPVVPVRAEQFPTTAPGFALLAAGEMAIGAIFGLSVRLLLTAVQIMGQLVGYQMGFAVANVIDPIGGGQVSVLAQFAFLMSLLILFAVDAHHWFFRALADSFRLVPPGRFAMSRGLFDQMVSISGQMFSLSVRLGAPVIGALLFTQVVLGILAKTVPQMNILMVGFPITITVGLVFLALALTYMLPALARVFAGFGPMFTALMRGM